MERTPGSPLSCRTPRGPYVAIVVVIDAHGFAGAQRRETSRINRSQSIHQNFWPVYSSAAQPLSVSDTAAPTAALLDSVLGAMRKD